ncbi:pregnancy zone protein-like [Diadema antillarum]|uniref:pregnancy zone protein-like n=1 Tax=Diadema antillarum TaxID=105358 RepID=UPI003A8C53C9
MAKLALIAVVALTSLFVVCSTLVAGQDAQEESGVIVMYPKKLRLNKVGTGCFTMKNLVTPVSMELNITYLTLPCPTVIVQKSLDDVDTCLDVDLGCEATESERIGPRAGPILVNFHHVFTGEKSAGGPFTQVFEKEMLLGYEVTHTFVQTDKPLYKPGQKVMFRVLTVDYPDMIPVPDHAHTVFIESPGGTRMKQWKNLLSPDGLLDLQFTLSDEPEMGTWRIRVRHHGHMPDSVQTFDVEEYVLPKFEVKVTPKTGYIFAPEPSPLLFTVCAMYTYGQPVRGSIEATILLGHHWLSTTTLERIILEADTSGCAEFNYTFGRGTLRGKEIKVVSNFTEVGTGVWMQSQTVSIPLSHVHYKVKIQGPDFFKPGLPYRGQVVLSYPDGTPVPGIAVRVQIEETRRHISVVTQTNGIGRFEIKGPSDPLIVTLTLRATDAEGGSFSIPTKSVNAWYSTSGSFLDVGTFDQTVISGQDVNVNLTFTRPTSETTSSIKFFYRVLSRGRVVSSGQETWTNPNVINPPVEIHEEIQREVSAAGREKRSSPPYFGGRLRTTEVRAPVLLPYPSLIVENLVFSFTATAEMSPLARLLVFYIRGDGEVVSANGEIKIAPAFQNKVSVEFDEGREVRPGQPASVRVSAQPSSLCAVGVVDKSVHIMAGDNQLTKDKVFTPVNSFNDVPFRRSESCPRTEEIVLPPNSNARTRWYSKHVDSSASFGMAGVDVMSDFELETRPCWVTITRYIPCHFPDPCWVNPVFMSPNLRGIPGPRPGGFVLDSEPVAMMFIPERVELEPADEARPLAELRNYFPETWLWKLSRIGASGQQVTSEEIPHTITDWVASAFCLSPTHGVGVADSTSIRAFQPFFLSYTLPYSVLRGEKVPVKVSVFNYLTGCLTVELSMTESTSFSIETGPESPVIEVCGSTSRTVEYELIFSELGDIPIRVDAVANRVADGNGDIAPGNYTFPAADALEDTILVEPEGAEREETFSEMICPDDEGDEPYSKMVTLALPEVIVPGSARGRIQVIGDVIGPVMSNLGQLLRMPFGCGEQNMITMAPSIFVMHYLTETNQLTNEISSKALEYMESGYQRELKYQLPDGSYSAFGTSDGVGSTWLSAFVLKCFSLAKEFMEVDEMNLGRTQNWLLRHSRDAQGCVIKQGRVIHKEMQGSVSSPVTMTAFVTVAMLESGASPDDQDVILGLECMEHWLNTTVPFDMNTYALALTGYAFGLGNYFSSQSRALSLLNDRAQEENGLRFWSSGDAVEKEESLCIHHCHADSSGVEITAYVLLAHLHQNQPFDVIFDDVLPIVRWLNAQRNALGGFSSTQDTVLGLQAVAQFAERVYGPDSSLDLQIGVQAFRSGSRDLTEELFFDIDNSNHLVLQREDLREVPADLWISSRGSGCALFQAELRYNVPVVPPQRPLFNISVTIGEWNGRSQSDSTTCGDRTVHVCVRYTGNEVETGMAVMEVKMVSGFIPHEDSLETFRDRHGAAIGLKRIDKYANGKPLTLYFDSFDSIDRCVPIKVKQEMVVKDAKSSVIKVYDYYKPDLVSFENYHPCELANEL